MRKTLVVAVREYQAAVRTKAFIISMVLMPILMSGGVIMPKLLEDKVDTSDKRIAIVDQTGQLFDAVAEAVQIRNTETTNKGGIFKVEGEQRKQVRPRFVLEKVDSTEDDPERVRLGLSNRVREGGLFAFMIIGPEVIEPGEDAAAAVAAYHSNSPTYDDFQRWVTRPLNNRIQQLRFETANLDPEVVQKATQWTSVKNLGLVSLDEDGNIVAARETNEIANILIPMALMMLMFMVVMVGASPLVHSVLEEKMQRIAEVLLGSIPPFELMMGKLLGMVGVSLTIATFYVVGAFYAVHRSGFAHLFPADLLWWFIAFLALAVLMFGAVFIAIGAAVTDMKEAQSLMTPVMLVVVAPMFVWIYVVREPSAPLSILMSLFPPATPMLMTIRQSVPPGVPVWQPLLGILLVLLTTVVCVFAAGRIFRVGILMQGKGANLGQMLRWVLRG